MIGTVNDITALLADNEPPSEDMVAQIREWLVTPSKGIESADAQIGKMEETLKGLKARLASSKAIFNKCQAVISPTRRLPPDILREIFLHCLPTRRNSILKASEAPMLLTRVCSAWRSVALSSPRIWARLYVPFPGNTVDAAGPFVGERSPSIDSPDYLETMKKRCKVVEEWISRSGNCPLSISIHYSTFHSIVEDHLDKPTEELFEIILKHVERWEELELTMPFDIHDKFQAKFSVSQAKKLKNLRTTFFDRERTGLSHSRSVPLFAAPTLRHLAFNAMPITWNIQSLDVSPVWKNLITLGLHSAVGDVDVLDILRLTPNLIHCRLSVLSRLEPTNSTTFRFDTSKGVAHLPHLETLSISDNGLLTVMIPTCRAIDAPALRWLDYYRPSFYTPPSPFEGEGEDTLQCPFIPLLSNAASTLTKLCWEPTGIKDLQSFFQTPYNLRHLVMGQEPLYLRRPGRNHFPRPPNFTMSNFDLTAFMVPETDEPEHPRVMEDDLDHSFPPILLPHLQVLEAYQVTSVTDEVLLQFIRSRLRRFSRGRSPETVTTTISTSSPTCSPSHRPIPSSIGEPSLNNGIAALRKVIIEFDRPKQIDIKDDVQKVAQEAGIDFHLELFYAPDIPAHHNPHSASFGLSEDDRSWTYSSVPHIAW